MIKLCTEL